MCTRWHTLTRVHTHTHLRETVVNIGLTRQINKSSHPPVTVSTLGFVLTDHMPDHQQCASVSACECVSVCVCVCVCVYVCIRGIF